MPLILRSRCVIKKDAGIVIIANLSLNHTNNPRQIPTQKKDSQNEYAADCQVKCPLNGSMLWVASLPDTIIRNQKGMPINRVYFNHFIPKRYGIV